LDKAGAVTVKEVWTVYMEQRRSYWGPLHYQDHIIKTKMGGLPSAKRGEKRLTTAGPLATFMHLTKRVKMELDILGKATTSN
jgi:hypothetical protein